MYSQLETLYKKAIFVNDVIDAAFDDSKVITSITRKQKEGCFYNFYYKLEWFYHVKFKKLGYRLLAVTMCVVSALILWCQLTAPLLTLTGINFSPFYWLIVALDYMHLKPTLQFYSLIIIAILSMMIYFSLFHFKVLYYYQLIPHHSDGASLFFFAV